MPSGDHAGAKIGSRPSSKTMGRRPSASARVAGKILAVWIAGHRNVKSRVAKAPRMPVGFINRIGARCANIRSSVGPVTVRRPPPLTSGIKRLKIDARLRSHTDRPTLGRNRPPVPEKSSTHGWDSSACRADRPVSSRCEPDPSRRSGRHPQAAGKPLPANGTTAMGVGFSTPIDFDLQLCAGGRCQQERK